MRDAFQCALRKCRCGRALRRPTYGYPHTSILVGITLPERGSPSQEKIWHQNCPCGVTYVWSYHEKSNSCWILRSIHPLMDSGEIVVVS